MLYHLFFFAVSVALLVFGADILLKSAVMAARKFRLSPFVIGLTIVAFGTSLPELLVCYKATAAGNPGIAIGNVIGSNIANIILLLGITGLITPICHVTKHKWRDGIALLLSGGILTFLGLKGMIYQLDGLLCLLALIGYLIWTYISDRQSPTIPDEALETCLWFRHPAITLLGIGVGIYITVKGGDMLVRHASAIARLFDISDEIIGLTLVSIGTSLPELATLLVAAFRKQTSVAIGNIIGSNIFNSLGVIGCTATLLPIDVPEHIVHVDLWFMMAISAMFTVLIWLNQCVTRPIAALFLCGYVGYVVSLAI